MTSEELAEIEARANAATPGPWTTHVVYRVITPRAGDDGYLVADCGASESPDCCEGNAPFIAHARTDVPALVAEVASLTAEVERLGALVPRWVFATPSLGDLMVGECRIGSVLQVGPLDWNAWVTDLNGAAWSYIGWEQTVEAACAAVCRRLGLPDIKPPENTDV